MDAKLMKKFKSPVVKKQEVADIPVLTDQLQDIEAKLADTDQKISQLENMGVHKEELQVYIDKLHTYNDIKDLAQGLLGKLAVHENVCTKN
ncbi:hypothetical protein Ahia01_001367700, partial [Argonauta hians]